MGVRVARADHRRTKENLGTTDKGIVLYRRLLLDSIRKVEAGQVPPGLEKADALTGPPAIDGVGPTSKMDEYWKECDAERRKKSAWAP